jgi:hypothetical protein
MARAEHAGRDAAPDGALLPAVMFSLALGLALTRVAAVHDALVARGAARGDRGRTRHAGVWTRRHRVHEASLFRITPVLAQYGIPAEGVGILIAVEPFRRGGHNPANPYGGGCPGGVLCARSQEVRVPDRSRDRQADRHARHDDDAWQPRVTGAHSSLERAELAHVALAAMPVPRVSVAGAAIKRWWAFDPPYGVATSLRDAAGLDEMAPPGRLLVYESGAGETSASLREAAASVYYLNARSPRVLVAGAKDVAPAVWAGMKDAGFRCGIMSLLPDMDALRAALCNSADVEIDLLRWLVRAGIAIKPHVLDHFVEMLTGPASEGAGDVDVTPRRSRRTRSRHFAAEGLAAPRNWQSTFRWLRMAMAAQRDPRLTEAEIVERNSLYDDSDLRRVFHVWFGCTVTDVRNRLGWEWLLWAAIERKQLTAGLEAPPSVLCARDDSAPQMQHGRPDQPRA